MAGGIVLAAVLAWYLTLYQPVSARTADLSQLISSQEDSLAAIGRYKVQMAALGERSQALEGEIEKWDASFPSRSSIVSLANEVIRFSHRYGLELIELEPSLFELYALERAGTQTSGQFVMHLPLRFRLKGHYLNLGRMIEHLDELPFVLTVADIDFSSISGQDDLLDIRLSLFLYVHV